MTGEQLDRLCELADVEERALRLFGRFAAAMDWMDHGLIAGDPVRLADLHMLERWLLDGENRLRIAGF